MDEQEKKEFDLEEQQLLEQEEQYLLNVFRRLTPENRARLILVAAAMLQ